MDPHCKHQALGVHEKVAFSTLNLLAAFVSSLFSTYPGRFDQLAVFEASTRSRTDKPRIRSPLAVTRVYWHHLKGDARERIDFLDIGRFSLRIYSLFVARWILAARSGYSTVWGW
jgi:hypothetical protein